MKYCLRYNKDTYKSKYINEADEWNIQYNPKDKTLLQFLEENQNKRINLCVDYNIDFRFLKELCNKFSNLYIRFDRYSDIYIENIVEQDFPFFFEERVNNWDTFLGLIECGVTDIYVVEDLCFELDKVAEIAHQENIKLRTYPNVAQSAWIESEDLKKFFIRPEDIDIYSDYIDIIEFFGEDKKQDIYYKIYKYDKKWFGLLKELIIGFNSDLDSKYIIPRFPDKRISCRKSCLKGGNCRRCDRIKQLSHTLEQSELIVRIDKER